MIIADLNYFENADDRPTYGGFYVGESKKIGIEVNIAENVLIGKNLKAVLLLQGNLSTAEAGATAFGKNTLAEAFGFTYTDHNGSSSNSFSISATSSGA